MIKDLLYKLLTAKFLQRYSFIFLNFFFAILTRPIKRINRIGEYMYEIIESDDFKYVVQHSRRLFLFTKGFKNRQIILQNEYLLNNIKIPNSVSNLLFVDVGANIGEMSYYSSSMGFKYLAFEPDPQVYPCLKKNVEYLMRKEDFNIFNSALGSIDGEIDFYLATEKADSSVIVPIDYLATKIKVPVQKLDSFHIVNYGQPFILKLEAEGFEEGVLLGALNVLTQFTYIVIDCGPENGLKNTMPECLNIVCKLGFNVIEVNLNRGVVLFCNNNSIL